MKNPAASSGVSKTKKLFRSKLRGIKPKEIKNTSDRRPESYKLYNWDDIKLHNIIDTKNKK